MKIKKTLLFVALNICVLQAFTQNNTQTIVSSDSLTIDNLIQQAEQNINTYPTLSLEQVEKALFYAETENNYNNFIDALIVKVKLLYNNNNVDEAEKQKDYLNKMAKRHGTKEQKAKIELINASVSLRNGDIDEAIETYNQIIATYSKSKIYNIAAIAENQLGCMYREKGLPDMSQKSFLKAIEYESYTNEPDIEATSLNYLGSYHWRNGQYNLALDYYQKSLEIREDINNQYDITNSYINIGNTYLNIGDYDKALTYQNKALKNSINWENQLPKAQIFNYIGNIFWRKSLYDSSLVYYHKSINIYTILNNKQKIASLYDNIGNAYKMNSLYDSATHYYNEALKIREELNLKADVAYSLSNLGSINWKSAKYPQALNYYFQALMIREEIGDKANIANSMNNIGLIYKELGDYSKAIKYQKDAFDIYQSLGNKAQMAATLNQLGNVYWTSADLKLALKNHMQALRIRQEMGDQNAVATSLNNIGLIYRDLKDYEKAESFFFDALEIHTNAGNLQAKGLVINNIGDVYAHSNKNTAALETYQNALTIFNSTNDKRGIAITSQNIGQLYLNMNQPYKAQPFFDTALKNAQQINDIEIIKNVSYDNYTLYKEINNQAKALESFILYNNYRDTISNSTNLQRMLEMQSLYEINIKEKEIELLKTRSENIALKINHQQRNILFISIALFLIILLCGTIYIAYRNKKRSNEMLRKTFSIIAHDLRSPLASLSNLTGLLNQNEISFNDNELKEIYSHTNQLTHSTLHLLETLLEWSVSQNNDIIEYNPEKLDVQTIVTDTIDIVTPITKSKKLKLINLIPNENLQVFADRKGFLMILRNLIMNATKYSHNGGEICISAYKVDKEIVISIKDFGIGIEPKALEQITKGLNSDSRRGTMNEKGFGLGMKFCNDFVVANKGRLWAESEVNKYTIFYFSLPSA